MEDAERREYFRKYYLKNRERIKAATRLRYQEHREEAVLYNVEYRRRPYAKRARTEFQRRQRVIHAVKFRARKILLRAVTAGKIERNACEVCGSLDVHGHHEDYTQPLKVRWLCPEHHRDAHNRVPLIKSGA